MDVWQPIETIPSGERVLVWVATKLMYGVQFGSAYRHADGEIVAKPEGSQGNWSRDITHWMPLPAGPA